MMAALSIRDRASRRISVLGSSRRVEEAGVIRLPSAFDCTAPDTDRREKLTKDLDV
jgi:hypothetical protein